MEVPESGTNYGYGLPGNGTPKGSINTGTQSASHTHTISGSTADGGFANTALDVTPAHYTAIFIRKCA